MEYNYNYYYYHSSIPYSPKVGKVLRAACRFWVCPSSRGKPEVLNMTMLRFLARPYAQAGFRD